MKGKIRDFFIVLIWYIFLFKEIRREFDVIFLFNKFLVNLYSFLILLLGYFQVVSDFKVIVFFKLGINGIVELQVIDLVFDVYQEVLFGELIMIFQRSVQIVEVNVQIDEIVEFFFQRLILYCLFKLVYKVLEWLIFRYKGVY